MYSVSTRVAVTISLRARLEIAADEIEPLQEACGDSRLRVILGATETEVQTLRRRVLSAVDEHETNGIGCALGNVEGRLRRLRWIVSTLTSSTAGLSA